MRYAIQIECDSEEFAHNWFNFMKIRNNDSEVKFLDISPVISYEVGDRVKFFHMYFPKGVTKGKIISIENGFYRVDLEEDFGMYKAGSGFYMEIDKIIEKIN